MMLSEPAINDIRGPSGKDWAVQFGNNLTLTYWDLWCLLTAHQNFAGAFYPLREALIARLKAKKFWSESTKELIEDLIALTLDLEERIRAHASVSELISLIPERIVKKEEKKALRNILEQSCHYPPSEPMLRSPRRLLQQEAYRGLWKRLPIDPTPFADKFRALFIPPGKSGFFHKGMTFTLSRKIQKQVHRELENSSTFSNPNAHRYAIYRSLITLFHEEHHWDDSYGVMGELGTDWVKGLLQEAPATVGASAEIFLKDLLMILCWENYGLTNREMIASYIRNSLSQEHRPLVVQILTDIRTRAAACFQEYHAEEADRILKVLGAAVGKFDVPLQIVTSSIRQNHLRLVAPNGS